MIKFSTGLFAGAVIGMGVAMVDRLTLKGAKKMAKMALRNLSGCSM